MAHLLIDRAGLSIHRWVAALMAACVVGLLGCAAPVASAAGLPADIERSKAEPAQVRVQGDTLYYTGNFSKASTAAFDAATAGLARGQLTRLVISSGGGDTVAGRHVGRWVRDMGLVVEVDVICFSSCADYVFPAGRARVIRSDAFVGWHGNEHQFELLAARRGTTLAQELARFAPAGISGEQRAAFVDEFLRSIAVTRKDEAAFYASLGLDDTFAVCAVGDDLEKRPGYDGQKGWGFSVADMERLGLRPTVYLGEGRYEQDSARFRQNLVLLGADECRAMMK
ncbi:hypothetical protein [Hydrogenophaga sp.]|uniref:hypothetical protein n=1 Tax=Hydrogenophaga sp. TaxID=1904254 RepID=UPI0035B1861E